jgi:DNA repair protein RadC
MEIIAFARKVCSALSLAPWRDTHPGPHQLVVRDREGRYQSAGPDQILQAARAVLNRKVCGTDAMTQPQLVKDCLRARIGHLEHEVFGVIHLDTHHRVLKIDEMFRGSLTQTSVYPREVVKEVLACNSCAVILFHNHPSGSAEPSRTDEVLTAQLRAALSLVDVRVLDHMIVTSTEVLSFAERGLI